MYRPWGLTNWLWRRLKLSEYSVFGCLGSEERSVAAARLMREQALLSTAFLCQIRDKPDQRYAAIAEAGILARRSEYQAAGGHLKDVHEFGLLDAHSVIVGAVDEFAAAAGPAVVLDVTSLPKRFMFPVLKRLYENPHITTLLITYTRPESYPPDTERLAEDHNDWAQLPLFSGEYQTQAQPVYVISTGFEELGLLDHLTQDGLSDPLELLVPFPAPPPAVRRSWKLVRMIEHSRPPDAIRINLVDSIDVSDAFDCLLRIGLQRDVVLAPFGPKPAAVAMCLYAMQAGSPVYYTQPTIYNPAYSQGVARIDGEPAVYGYVVKHAGTKYYVI